MSESYPIHKSMPVDTKYVPKSRFFCWRMYMYIGIAIAYAMLCFFYDQGRGTAVRFPDTGAFELSAARASVTELDFYITSRPFTTLFLYKAFPGNSHMILGIQVCFAFVSWLVLAYAVAQLFHSTATRVLGVVFVLSLSLAWPIQSWNYVMLSESLSFSLMALVCGLTILMFCQPGKYLRAGMIIAWIFLIVLWCGTRDTVTYTLVTLVLLVVAALAPARLWRREHGSSRERQIMVFKLLAMGAFLAFAVTGTNWLSERSGRWKTPVLNTLLMRMLPDPNAYNEWVTVLGMPDSPRLHSFVGKYSWDRVNKEYEIRELLLETRKEGDQLNGFQEWYAARGLKAMRGYLLRHPLWTIKTAAQEYVNLLPNRAEEYHVDVPKPLVSRIMAAVFYPEIGGQAYLAFLVVVFGMSLVLCTWKRLWALPAVSFMLFANSFIQMTVAFHGDFAEPNRHTFLASILLRMALLISLVALIEVLANRDCSSWIQKESDDRAATAC